MVRTRSNLSIKKKNGSRKIKKGGAKSTEEKRLQAAIGQKGKSIPTENILASGAAGAVGLAIVKGASKGIASTTLGLAGVGQGAVSAGSWLGSGALIGVGGSVLGPIFTAVAASVAIAYATFSVKRKKKLQSRIKHFIKRQMLATLDEMVEKSKKFPKRYPELQGYAGNEKSVKKFFVDYGIFSKLADIFLSFQSNMLHFYPSERLMYPIQFDDIKNEETGMVGKIPWKEDEHNLGENFLCFYDYLTSDEHLYFTSDALNDGTTTSYLRLKLKTETWYKNTPAQIIEDLQSKLNKGNLKVKDANENKPVSEEEPTTVVGEPVTAVGQPVTAVGQPVTAAGEKAGKDPRAPADSKKRRIDAGAAAKAAALGASLLVPAATLSMLGGAPQVRGEIERGPVLAGAVPIGGLAEDMV